MKKNLLYLFLFAALCVIVVFIFKKKQNENKIPADHDFAVENTDEIDKIFLSDKDGNRAVLKKADADWVINDKYNAMQAKVDVLLETIRRVAVQQPVSKPKWDNVIKELATTAIKVELYKKGDKKPFKVYLVGGPTEDSKGSYMIMQVNGKIADRPYVTHIPGFVGYLSGRYFLNETEWRSTAIFEVELKNIKEVVLDYPDHPENSFRISAVAKDSFSVFPLHENVLKGKREVYYPGVIKYLSSFDFLHAESFANELGDKDSITSQAPYLFISVTDRQGNTKKMTVFYMPLNKRSKLQHDQSGNELPFDLDRFYALINDDKDFVVVQNYVFGKVFRNYEDFLKKAS